MIFCYIKRGFTIPFFFCKRSKWYWFNNRTRITILPAHHYIVTKREKNLTWYSFAQNLSVHPTIVYLKKTKQIISYKNYWCILSLLYESLTYLKLNHHIVTSNILLEDSEILLFQHLIVIFQQNKTKYKGPSLNLQCLHRFLQ